MRMCVIANLYFYNNFHNGDIHYSREFVKDIISKTKFKNYFYIHSNKKGLLKDIEKLKEISSDELLNNNDDYFIKGDDIYINTWIGKSGMKYLKYGLNINANYEMYKSIYNFLNIDMNDVLEYIPRINFDCIEKSNIDKFFKAKKNNVLVSNGDFLSIQSTEERFEPLILKLNEKFKDFNFILTDKTTKLKSDNIFYSNDIIGIDTNINTDLLEISYLSIYCDVIIGKESGPFVFSTIYDNLMNYNKKFINFSNDINWVFYPSGKCEYIWSNNYEPDSMYDIIEKSLKAKSMVCYKDLGKPGHGQLGNQLFEISATIGAARDNDVMAIFPEWNYNKYFNNCISDDNIENFEIKSDYHYGLIKYEKILYSQNMNLHGYFQSEKYFKNYEKEIRCLFTLKPEFETYIKNKWNNLLKTNTVSIHVRRGDYLNNPTFHVCPPISYFKKSLRYIECVEFNMKIDNVLIFSDDIQWCKENFIDDYYKYNFIEGQNEIEDMFLMSYCNHNIITNSSFSWWGAWLNKNPNKIVCAPHRWFGDEWGMEYKDIYFDGVKIINYDVTSISDDSSYSNAVASSLKNDLRNFKRDDIYRRILEHTDDITGRMYYDIICQKYQYLIKYMDTFKKNDDIGNPIKFKYDEYEMSPTTLRYIKVLGDIISIFGDLNNIDIIEIGSGYGGQCKIIHDLFKPKSYTIVDLDDVMELNKRYLSYFDINNVIFKSSNDVFFDHYDLVISNYAFTECEKTIQEIYLNKIIKNSKNGYITCNFISNSFNINSFNKEDILNMLDVSYQIIPEEPITHHDNFILTWKKESNTMNDQKIFVFSVCYNEEDVLPFYLDYYSNFVGVDKIIIYDGGSTDNTYEILKKYPIVELIIDPQKDYSDKYLTDMKNNMWKKYKKDCNWIIVCDIDEFLYHKNIRGKLLEYDKNGITIPITNGYDMISLDFPSFKKGEYLPDLITKGIQDNHWQAKKIIFKSSIEEINYGGGSHDCQPIGEVKYSENRDFYMLHYKWLSFDYMTKRYKYLNERRSQWNLEHKASEHWKTFSEITKKEYIEKYKMAINFKKMDHFYEDVFGWFDFQDIYSSMVEKFESGSHFLEIGAWLGKSTSYLAVEIINSNKNIKFDVIDKWIADPEGTWSPYVLKEDPYEIFLKNLNPVINYINPIKGDSRELHENYDDNSIDFIFIDGDHEYDGVMSDIKNWFPKLKKNGIIAGHDYYPYETVQSAVNDYFGKDNIKIIKNSWFVDKRDYELKNMDPEELKILKLKNLENFMSNEKNINEIFINNEFENELLISYLERRNYKKEQNKYTKPKNYPIFLFSHNYLINNWKEILIDQLEKIKNSGLYKNANKLYLFAFGDDNEWNDFSYIIKNYDVDNKIEIKRHSDNFYEYHTLQNLWHFCQSNPDSYILYFHLKGVWSRYNTQTGENDEYDPTKSSKNPEALLQWKNCMEYFNIERWRNCIDKLSENYEVVGSLYNYNPECPLFTGNFWWANSNYIKKLDYLQFQKEKEPYDVNIWIRVKCEKWINSIKNNFYNFYNPKDLDLYHYVIAPNDYRDDINPLMSILTPTYKRYDELQIAIESVKNQTYDNWEMLICSDGDDNNVKNIIDSYNDNRIKYYFTERTNNWGSTQRNYLTNIANGKYIIYLDDDNIIYPNALKDVVDNFDKTTGMLIAKIDYDGLDHQLPVENKITLGKIDTLNAVVDRQYIKYISWKNYVGHDYEFIKICENNVLNDDKNIKFINNTIGRHVEKKHDDTIRNEDIEITLQDKIYLSCKKDIIDSEIFFKGKHGNVIYYFKGTILKNSNFWFIPDDRSFQNGFTLDIIKNNNVIFKSDFIRRKKSKIPNNKIIVFHHNYLLYGWFDILKEQMKDLKESGLYENCEEIIATIYTDYENNKNRKIFKDFIKENDELNKWTIIDLYENNFEYNILKIIKEYCEYRKDDFNICYFHLKGVCSTLVTHDNIGIPYWRKYLNYFTFTKWRNNILKLIDNDIVALDYQFNEMHQKYVIGGHFFWTKSNYINKLDFPNFTDNRYLPEIWITSKECKVYSNFFTKDVGVTNLYLQPILPETYQKDKIVLVCIAKDEDYYIEEWLNYNFKLGFDKIILYQNNWKCNINNPNLIKIDWPGEYQQLLAYNDFIDRLSDDYDYAAFLDCDEFLVLKKHKNIHEFIREYGKNRNICINWQFYGSCGKEKRDGNSLIKQFTKRQSDVNDHIKSIIYLRIDQWMERGHNPDYPMHDTNSKEVTGPWNKNGPSDVAIINHYKDKTLEDYKEYKKRGQVDVAREIDIQSWVDRKNIDNEVEDINALNFFYPESIKNGCEYISLLIGGAYGDFITLLSVAKYYYDNGYSVNLYLDEFGFIHHGYNINEVFDELSPFIKKQTYINIFEIYNNQKIDVNLSDFRKSGHLYNNSWTDILNKTFNVNIKPGNWIFTDYDPYFSDKILIHRSPRYHNDNFPWDKIINTYKDKILFISRYEEDYDIFPFKESVKYYKVNNINELSVAINSCEMFIGNQSLPLHIACALDKKMLIELGVDINHFILEKNYQNMGYYFDENIKKINIEFDSIYDLMDKKMWDLEKNKVVLSNQNEKELEELINILKSRKNDNILEIGVEYGGTTVEFCKIFKNVYSIDITEYGTWDVIKEHFPNWKYFIGDSNSEDIYNKIRNLNIKFDAIFIDGDHTYENVKNDYELYKEFVSDDGIIIFHDIIDGAINRSCNAWVYKLWEEIKNDYHYTELIYDNGTQRLINFNDYNYNTNNNNLRGIGILFKKEKDIHVFHHNYLVGNWYNIVKEEIQEIIKSGLYNSCKNIHTTIYAEDSSQYSIFYELIKDFDPDKKWVILKLSENNFEINCLELLYNHCKENDCYVLYFNNKGVTHDTLTTKSWRDYMVYFNINKYKEALDKLKEYDTYGIDLHDHPYLHYSGNFWWSKSDHIRKLNINNLFLNEFNNKDNKFIGFPMHRRHNCEMWVTSIDNAKYYSAHESNTDFYEDPYSAYRGMWINDSEYYHVDQKLANSLSDLLKGYAVADFGCGNGFYTKHLKNNNIECDGFDGNPKTVEITNGVCQILDLSKDINLNKKYDYILSLEVGEHIPSEFEETFINNIHKNNTEGVILSWAIEGQVGVGHVNCRNNDYIKNIFDNLGYVNDLEIESKLRNDSELPWFKNTIMVFKRIKNIVYAITSHPSYKISEDITKKTIDNIKNFGEKVILSSHCPVSLDLQRSADFFIYDKNNPLIRHDFFTQSWFTTDDYYALLNITKNDNNFNHALGVFINYYNSLTLAKSLGYETAVCTNFDMVFSKEDMNIINNRINEMKKLNKKAFFMNTPEREGIHYKTIFFITNIDFFLDNFKYINNEDIYNKEIKKVGSNTNCLENFFYHSLKNFKDNLLLEEINEEQLFPTSQINLFSLIEYHTILPIENDNEHFIIWFSSANSIDGRDFNIIIKKNNNIILNDTQSIDNKFIWYKKVRFNIGDNFEIIFVIKSGDEILKYKKINVDDHIFADIKSYGKFIEYKKIDSI